MAVENGRDGNTNTHEASSSKSQVEEEITSSSKNGDQPGSDKSKPEEKIPFHKLFSFADSTDILLMITGTIGAIGNGLGLPIMTILFGELINSFGNNQNDKVVQVVSKVRTKENHYERYIIVFYYDRYQI